MKPGDSACLPRKLFNNRHTMERGSAIRRFTRTCPCPICGGYDGLARGKGVRCFRYYDGSGKYARCTREAFAGSLPQNRDGTYSHRPEGHCACGGNHGGTPGSGDVVRIAPISARRQSEQRFRSYFTLRAFLRKRYGEGTSITPWVYRTGDGNEAFRVLRIDCRAPDGSASKSYRPCHQSADGRWRLARPQGRLPLYNLPAILSAPPEATIALFEGEKCSEIAAALGLPYVTASAHGAKAPQLTDWSPLAGRHVAILPDADDDGAGYAMRAAEILASLDPPSSTRIVMLPGLSTGDDIEQWIATRRAAGLTDAELLAELKTLIEPGR